MTITGDTFLVPLADGRAVSITCEFVPVELEARIGTSGLVVEPFASRFGVYGRGFHPPSIGAPVCVE